MELEVYKKSDFYEDYISSQKEYYERENADAYFAERLAEKDKALAEKDKEIALLKERICNGDVSRLTWIDDCIAKDKEIEELKKKLMPCLNGDCILTCEVVEKYGKENAELKQKLESVQASMYADVVDANMENRRLRRALYKACANWANFAVAFFSSYATKEKWHKMERRCLNKMEEYK